jgi:hypothetical protein
MDKNDDFCESTNTFRQRESGNIGCTKKLKENAFLAYFLGTTYTKL